MANPRQTTALLLLVAGLTLAIFAWVVLRQRPQLQPSLPTANADDPSRGPSDAPVTIIEYGDFQCPFCQQMADSLAQLTARYPSQARHVWKDYPLASHPEARPAALAARCAHRQGQFWPFHDRLFQQQGDLGPDLYQRMVADLNLDQATFAECLKDSSVQYRIDQAVTAGRRVGVGEVPTVFINGRRYEGALSVEELTAIIESIRN